MNFNQLEWIKFFALLWSFEAIYHRTIVKDDFERHVNEANSLKDKCKIVTGENTSVVFITATKEIATSLALIKSYRSQILDRWKPITGAVMVFLAFACTFSLFMQCIFYLFEIDVNPIGSLLFEKFGNKQVFTQTAVNSLAIFCGYFTLKVLHTLWLRLHMKYINFKNKIAFRLIADYKEEVKEKVHIDSLKSP